MENLNYKGKKIALIFGLSIEGAGVTRTGSEMQHWCDKNGVDLTIYSYDEIGYIRKKAHKLKYKSFKRNDIDNIVEELNTFDLVIFNSYPSVRFPKEAIIDFYEKLIKGITTIKVGFMHELNKIVIDKIPFIVGIMNQMDIIYNFSEETWFAKEISKLLPSKVLGERTKKFQMWFNFDILEQYRDKVDLSEKEKKLLYMGRYATVKDTPRVLDIGGLLLKKDPNFNIELMGIDTSIAAKINVLDHKYAINRLGKTEKKGPEGCVPIYGPYNRDEGMDSMAGSLFGCSFYSMPRMPENYGDRMEYTQIEIIAVGSIPVFDKHWGQHNKTLTGESYFDIPYSAIYSDKNNLEDTVDQLIKVANDPELQQKYRETSYKLVKQEFDADVVLPKLFNTMLETGIDKKKFATDDELLLHITKSQDFVNEAKKQIESGEILVFGFRELQAKLLMILEGKKEKAIKKFK